MNTYEFFNNGFGRFLAEQTNRPHKDAARALTRSHPIINKDGKPSTSRLTGWAIIRPNGSLAQANLLPPEIEADPRSRYEAFAAELNEWDGSPRMFLSFSKAPLPIANLFITADLRAVRICSPGEVETFNFTKEPEGQAGVAHRNVMRWRQKLVS